MDLFLIRHLPTESTKKAAFYGATDLGLSKEAIKYGPAFSNKQRSDYGFYTSPLKRCKMSAEIFFPNEAVKSLVNAKEVDFGKWEGMTFEEIAVQDPELVDQWSNDPEFSFPKGEKLRHFEERIIKLAEQLHTHEKVVLITHGGVIRYLICYFLGLDFNKSLLFNVDLATLTHLQIFDKGKGVLKGLGIKEWQTYFS